MLRLLWALLVALVLPNLAIAARGAAIVVDANTLEILYSEDIDARLHPSQLTQLKTLLLAFEAIDNGQTNLNDRVLISHHAAHQPRPSFGLRKGQHIALRYLLVASASGKRMDAATAISEHLAGDEIRFVEQMNERAIQLCMLNSRFSNPRGNGGHALLNISTAHDVAILGAHIFQSHAALFTLTIRESVTTGDAEILGTHTRRAARIGGVNGMMTGYHREAGFVSLVSLRRDGRDLIAIVLGERSMTAAQSHIEHIVSEAIKADTARFGVLEHCQIS